MLVHISVVRHSPTACIAVLKSMVKCVLAAGKQGDGRLMGKDVLQSPARMRGLEK
jgi:hypothetical protein